MTDLPKLPIEDFKYKYLAGPLESIAELDKKIEEGNCRLALQVYFYRIHNKYFKKDEIYLPGGYKVFGKFIFEEEPIEYEKLKEGDVLYAQNLRDKHGKEVDKSLGRYKDKDEWLYCLHSAIYLGKSGKDHYIWHATNVEGGTALWTREKFEHYYKPVSAKRVLV